jgi:hypothetical protein
MVDRQELLNSTGQIETNQLARDSRLELFHTEPSNHCTRAYDMMLYRVHSFCYGQDTKDHLLNLTLPTKGSSCYCCSYGVSERAWHGDAFTTIFFTLFSCRDP